MINELSPHKLVNESVRETGLRDIRVGNFKKLLDVISSFKPVGGKLVDVGCAHGWFLEAAMGKFESLGIEPDEAVFNVTSARGLPVRKGYFPDALQDGEMFDVIVFNDVIEHIPEIGGVLSECYNRLSCGGLLVLNLPSSEGIFYKISRLFCRIDKFGYFERLWQKDLPSPHVHYFNSKNLSELLTKNSFATIKTGTLPTLGLAGLYSRISCAGNLGVLSKAIIYCAVAATLPVLRLLPGDIVYVVARKA
ncbi:class I SAM-dependent methyltransferase [uncultured Pseudomonas sp.]|uniref:class I SAM-dependent methyltransferase n=1 Tax=uncultured Pseudomonas sp. TaxID=114707 RepID=UPI0025F1802D|nr:class I SAM-dependent methyltransferase [uncultured Pseudomonas sp.]